VMGLVYVVVPLGTKSLVGHVYRLWMVGEVLVSYWGGGDGGKSMVMGAWCQSGR
jgi:hypothetical protein